MAVCEKEPTRAYIRRTRGVEGVILPRNVKYMIVETGGVLGRIKSFGKRHKAETFEFPLPAFTNCEKRRRPYYIDAVNKCGERMHLEVTAKAVKTGTRDMGEGQMVDIYEINVAKVVDADSRLGPFRRRKRVLEMSEEVMDTLKEYNFAPI